ncbi:hypothetical protein FD723_40840 (plasmid) [Nostoc sp. C052]|uniref:hypothetical protein n=1 Tax=Nostoc sp. C052 TaxID=2576902 RepID=UPI0015C3EA49|nr:hypothetical protein [Nostoc sp. C052]QLE46563.1 hypothetical protein FD723_40840 [Nostoc sp. C052]
MLSSIFFSRVEAVEDGIEGTTLTLASSPLPPGISYKVIGYCQIDNYTLIKWQQGDEEEYFTGETLWQDTTPIASTGGALELYTSQLEEGKTEYPPDRSVWSRVDSNVGNYGLSSIVAIALRSSENTVYF